jgi:hypothetical protein
MKILQKRRTKVKFKMSHLAILVQIRNRVNFSKFKKQKFFLCTVKNNGQKLVDFALRKSNFLFMLMFTWKLTELHRSPRNLHKNVEFFVHPREHQHEQKN